MVSLEATYSNANKPIQLHSSKTPCKIVSYIFGSLFTLLCISSIYMDHYLSTKCLLEGV